MVFLHFMHCAVCQRGIDNMTKQARSNLLLVLTAFIWGTAFAAQKAGLDYMGPYTFNCLRFLIGACVLVPVIFVMRRTSKAAAADAPMDKPKKHTFIGGICCGIVLFCATTLQQVALLYTDAGKAGFVTALYIVLVPILSIFVGKKVTPVTFLCVAIAAVGLYLLCAPTSGLNPADFNRGDLLLIISAFLFAAHILVVDYLSPRSDGVLLSCTQFLACGLIASIPMLLLETPQLQGILAGYIPLLFTGAFSCGVAYTLQIIAQKHTEPTTASLIMSTEAVFAVLAGILLLNEVLTMRELIGCIVMFAAITLAQFPDPTAVRMAQADQAAK